MPRGIPQDEGRGYARWHPMDNSACNKLEDRRNIFLRRGQMFLLASAERRNPRFNLLRLIQSKVFFISTVYLTGGSSIGSEG
ncbi:hypothetical protein [Desulfosporosinus sp. OT]|uniref:hypothetical protein n=1 Tax=Desulfosporosinus sp. OT TaxID=913865 RepID=UPI001A98D840|nr:hypothetical protein [Desulfosporosinus sp. OT]